MPHQRNDFGPDHGSSHVSFAVRSAYCQSDNRGSARICGEALICTRRWGSSVLEILSGDWKHAIPWRGMFSWFWTNSRNSLKFQIGLTVQLRIKIAHLTFDHAEAPITTNLSLMESKRLFETPSTPAEARSCFPNSPCTFRIALPSRSSVVHMELTDCDWDSLEGWLANRQCILYCR
jgi:hypothetical protein